MPDSDVSLNFLKKVNAALYTEQQVEEEDRTALSKQLGRNKTPGRLTLTSTLSTGTGTGMGDVAFEVCATQKPRRRQRRTTADSEVRLIGSGSVCEETSCGVLSLLARTSC